MTAPRRSPDAGPASDPAKFEDLLERLETIVANMEAAELPLEKLLSSYEEGMRLVKACGDKLADAEQKVEILSKSVQAAAPVAGASAPAVSSSVSAPLAGQTDTAISPAKPDEDIRLI